MLAAPSSIMWSTASGRPRSSSAARGSRAAFRVGFAVVKKGKGGGSMTADELIGLVRFDGGGWFP